MLDELEKTKRPRNHTSLSLTLKNETAEKLDRLCKERKLKKSRVVESILRDYLDKIEAELKELEKESA